MTASLTVALVLINVAAAVQSQFQQNWSFAIISNSHKNLNSCSREFEEKLALRKR